jgi:hypothetical protein
MPQASTTKQGIYWLIASSPGNRPYLSLRLLQPLGRHQLLDVRGSTYAA